jgi:riboflavin kinase / FMN adenylyltransferase
MEVFTQIAQIPVSPYAVVTAGTFDGVHKGHQKIIVKSQALFHHGHSYLLTYHPHPRLVLQPEYMGLKVLSTLDEKLQLLEQTGIDRVVVLPFTEAFSQYSGKQYVEEVLVEGLHTQRMIIGYDHRFGHNRMDGIEYLLEVGPEYGFTVDEIPREDVDSLAVSSTRIRKALESCQITLATEYLGRPYSIMGKVVHGKKLGRTIGYPTANLAIEDPHKLIPADGIYVAKVQLPNGKFLGGMLSIGMNPTVEGKFRTIEVHLFDFDEDIYGQELKVIFIDYLRAEEKYDGLVSLQAALAQDAIQSKSILAQNSF